jgi:polar amino acid transport system substrate-binding protein
MKHRDLFFYEGICAFTFAGNQARANECLVNGSAFWEPISFLNEAGRHGGIMADVAVKVGEASGITIKLGPKVRWAQLFRDLDSGKLGILGGIYHNEERSKKYVYSHPVTESNIKIFVKKGSEFDYGELKDLNGKKGLRPQGGSYGQIFDDYAKKHLKIEQVPTSRTLIFKKLIAGRADYAVLGQRDGERNMRNKLFENKITMLSNSVVVNEVFFVFSKESPCFEHFTVFNSALLRLKNRGVVDKIVESYP